ncbi:response regulator [Danxiaibacter flavus]|uniref:Response regulator n=1 Tax=Danxiaibacter flavus TaxID=3049108 RepID=A0ABV3ZMN6_9BACT|nr:response regulator [Chitinophagaceae bacterium DXS]
MEDGQIVFKSVLIAEDSAINQIFMQRSLGKICGRIDIAENGAQAVEFARANKYDIILMDIFMPEMDGYEATKVIREQLGVKTPIVAVTSVSLPGEEEKCMEAGMNGYIVKPFTPEVVKKLVSEKGSLQTEEDPEQPNTYHHNGLTINLNILFQLGDDTNEHIISMIQLFTDNMAVTVEKMIRLAGEQDWAHLQKTAHYAKSSLSVINVVELFELAKEIDFDCRGLKEIELIPAKVERFEKMFFDARDFLDDYITKI